MNTPRWLRLTGQTVSSNSPAILSGIAVAGVITTAILAVKATPEAWHALRNAKDDKLPETRMESSVTGTDLVIEPVVLTKREIIEVAWKFYIPAAISGAATLACIIGANQIGTRRNAALLGAYTIADTAFREYKDEVVKQIGVAKERKVTDEIQAKHIDEHPVKDSQVIITGGGDQLCYESLTGRYFKSDVESLRSAENEFNARILADMYASLNEFFELVGLAGTIVGDELGFNIDNLLKLVFTSHLASDGRPCLAIGYASLPRKDYGKF